MTRDDQTCLKSPVIAKEATCTSFLFVGTLNAQSNFLFYSSGFFRLSQHCAKLSRMPTASFSVVTHSAFQRSPRVFDLGFIHKLRMPSLISRLALFLSRCKIQTGRNCLLFSSTAWRFCWRCAAFFEQKRRGSNRNGEVCLTC